MPVHDLLYDNGGAVINVRHERYGAAGNDARDDTDAIQRAIDACPVGGTVYVPAGTYLVDATRRPEFHKYGGVRLKSRMTFEMHAAAVLQARPTSSGEYSVLRAQGVRDVTIVGGTIRGERDRHIGTAGEWGHGIAVVDSDRVSITGTSVEDCWGDCIFVGTFHGARYSSEVRLDGVTTRRGRRQGLSAVTVRGLRVVGCGFYDTGGTAPAGGIDLEPDSAARPNQDVVITGCHFAGNGTDLYVAVGNRNVVVSGNVCRGLNGIVVTDNAVNVAITGNVVELRQPAAAGAGAFRVVAADPSSIDGVRVADNVFAGGDQVVIDVPYAAPKNLDFSNNTVVSERGGLRLARIFAVGATVSGNRFLTRGAGGQAGNGPDDWTVHLKGVRHGGNSFVNTGRHPVFTLLDGTRLVGDDYYDNDNFRRGLNGPTGLHSRLMSGRAESGGAVRAGAVWTAAVWGLDATSTRIVLTACGGGENRQCPGSVEHWVSDCTPSGFTLNVRNAGPGAQTLRAEWLAVT